MAKDYQETIEFSEQGIRLAVLEDNGKISHFDNWTLDIFGGALPAVGDFITELWDKQRPDPAESYLVIERHWIGEFKGDNCWWILLKRVSPTDQHRLLHKLARKESAFTRRTRREHEAEVRNDLQELRKLLEERKAAKRKPKA